MTERLYYRDADLRTFIARVDEVTADGTRVYLDRTAFYPTSGGQPHDTGALGGVSVIDVVDEGERIAHVMGAAFPHSSGSPVEGAIDWIRRHDHMQQHTGQHLLSAVLHDQLGRRTASVHFGPASSTLDLEDAGNTAPPTPEQLAEVEDRVNRLVGEARPVTVSFVQASEADGLRKPSDREGELRVVTIEGIDRSACGGTHVASTAAIGAVLLRRQERVKQGLRIEFVCGHRALARARRDLTLLTSVARAFSGSLDDVAGLVESQSAALRECQAQQRRLLESLAGYRASELHAATPPDESGLRRIAQRVTGAVDDHRALAIALSALPGVIYVAASVDPPAILLAASADSGVDAGKALQPMLKAVGGRGGGSPRLAQGSAPDPGAVELVLGEIVGLGRMS